jgi:hypothetical protein
MKYNKLITSIAIFLIVGTIVSPPVYETPEIVKSDSVFISLI